MGFHGRQDDSCLSLDDPVYMDPYQSFPDTTAVTVNPAVFAPFGHPKGLGLADESASCFDVPMAMGYTVSAAISALPGPNPLPNPARLADQFGEYCGHFLHKNVPIAAAMGPPSQLQVTMGKASLELRLSSTVQDRPGRRGSGDGSPHGDDINQPSRQEWLQVTESLAEFCHTIIQGSIQPDGTQPVKTRYETNNVRLEICLSPERTEADMAQAGEQVVPQPAPSLASQLPHMPFGLTPQAVGTTHSLSQVQPGIQTGIQTGIQKGHKRTRTSPSPWSGHSLSSESPTRSPFPVSPEQSPQQPLRFLGHPVYPSLPEPCKAASPPSSHDSHESPRYSKDEWNQMMPAIKDLYRKHTVKEIVPILEKKHNFHVSESKLKKRLSENKFYKQRPRGNSR